MDFSTPMLKLVGPEEVYFKREVIVMYRSLLILLEEIPSPGQ